MRNKTLGLLCSLLLFPVLALGQVGTFIPNEDASTKCVATPTFVLEGSGTCVANAGGGGLANVVEDLTPELGGDLDGLGQNIINVATMSVTAGTTLSNADTITAVTARNVNVNASNTSIGAGLVVNTIAGGLNVNLRCKNGAITGISGLSSTCQLLAAGSNGFEIFHAQDQPLILGTNATQILTLDDGHLIAGGAAPGLSSCGTSPTILGSDVAGTVTIGSSASGTCTLTFSETYGTKPACSIGFSDPDTPVGRATTATTLILTDGAGDFSSDEIDYICIRP